MAGGRPWPRRPLWHCCTPLGCLSRGWRSNCGPIPVQGVLDSCFSPVFHSLFFAAAPSLSHPAAGLGSLLPREAGGTLLSTGTPRLASSRLGSLWGQNRCSPRVCQHCPPSCPRRAGGGGREAPRVDARPAASSRAGWAALPHVQLSRRHLASPPGRQPSLPLVLGSPPPRHGMKLKAIIKIVSPNPGQTSQSELARAVPVAGGWGRNSCPQGIRWGKRSLAGFPPPPTPKQPSCFPSRLLCRGRTSAGMRVLSFPLSRHILVRRRCKSWSKPFVLSGL